MSWHRIVLPINGAHIDPDVVRIGMLGQQCYERENKPAGFGMLHATEGPSMEVRENWIIYLSPVAASLCKEIAENYKLEPCDVPARDEPNMAWVFGDPLVMGQLQDSYEAKLANSAT